MANKKVPIKYTNRDFESIRNDLVSYVKTYYPDTVKDFSESSFSSMMIDTVAYVGDILSFYMDYQVNEGFLDSAIEYENVIRLAKQHGYKFKGSQSATGMVAFYAIVPANTTGLGPDSTLLPILKQGTQVSSGNATYILTEDVRFDNPNNEQVAARVDTTTGVPTSYAIKAFGQVISGVFDTETITVGAYERFKKIKLAAENVVEIISVFDAEGHEFYEVENLSQNVIFKDVANTNSSTKDDVPAVLKPHIVPRRFVTERQSKSMFLQFGYGSDSELTSASVAEPNQIVLQKHGKTYTTDETIDPSKLFSTTKFGIVPTDTTLTVRFRRNTSRNVNASVGAVNSVVSPSVTFSDPSLVSRTQAQDIIASLEASNEEPIIGSISLPTVRELRRRTLDSFATQNRAVTKTDYEAMTYAMPNKYGAVKRCSIYKDPDSLKRNLNMYVLSENTTGNLITANDALKQNLKFWLNSVRMINDTVDILDARVMNIGVDFEVVAAEGFNKFDVLQKATVAIRNHMKYPFYIGEPFYITDIYGVLNKVRGVADVIKVKIKRRSGSNYSSTTVDIDDMMSADGRYLKVPNNVCLEMKYPKNDIRGFIK